MSSSPRIAIIMGSDSDWKVMKKAKDMLERFQVEAVSKVVSAHRTPEDLSVFAAEAEKTGIKIIIAGAGGAAHLPGMVASFTTLPVIGVPINATSLNGLDSLLSIVQMPEGIPVATVAIENAGNAALLALRILGIEDTALSQKLKTYREDLATASRKKTDNLK
jgi:phosphoribosylaminoimidazole carboxylase PurE protein